MRRSSMPRGGIVAASPGFDGLGIAADTLAALVGEARGDRLVKRMIPAQAGALPAGFVRLTDDPATHLLAVIDEPEQDAAGGRRSQPDAAWLSRPLPNLPQYRASLRQQRTRKLWLPPMRRFRPTRAKRSLPS